MDKFTIQTCPLCGGVELERTLTCIDHYASGEVFHLCRCRDCGFLMTQDFPPENEIGRYYETPDYISHSDTRKGMVNSLYHYVRTYMLKRKARLVMREAHCNEGCLLDVGTGTGVMIPYIRERVGSYVPIVAVDSSAKMLHEASLRYAGEGVHFIQADVERDRLAGRFDAILLYSVFPHFRYPVDTIARLVTDNLRCGGRLLIAHAQGRRHLNQIHERLVSQVFSRKLLPVAEQVEQFTRVGLTVTSFDETDESYHILLQRVGVGDELSVSVAEAIYE